MQNNEWTEDCLRYIGRVLTGKFKHWCPDWDFCPIDETLDEFVCCNCDFGPDMEEKNAIKALFELTSKQEELPKDMKKILDENLWDLYER